ncbi:MAG: WD40 repeat domain-containing protein [Halieaceae bacterium]|nr:WD40 repeat domain-containing protein [Halieaceae bacterium]MCP5147699.1 WD40 repeat domain-containing protein [Pseudomonadales bacterium]MCP5167410.1 WD40 repeat domain-containing protein [Pseudomonadales bacterium]MCP5187015.1 WD40 repeat domain-containing protein [Pseudomonadales bacterium]
MKRRHTPVPSLFAAALALTLCGCGVPDGTLVTDCEDRGPLHPVCGLQSPEDIAVVPGGDYLLLSELGNMGEFPGRIALFRVADESVRTVFPVAGSAAPDVLQGDPACTEPPGQEMSPHGTHLVRLEDGSWRYLVVNHGGREAVELFSLAVPADGEPQLQWQGCVFPADNTLINDVVGLANGDVIYTRMFRPDDFLGSQRALLGFRSGDVWRWSQGGGPRLLPGTAGALTNGIEISPDERYIFINQYMDGEIHKYDLQTEQRVATAAVAHADNSSWGPDGQLWLASHQMEIPVYLACTEDHGVTCGMGFEIVALDPETMATRVLFRHQGPPMGAATVATAHGDTVYLGSFLGDRLLIVPLAEFAQ